MEGFTWRVDVFKRVVNGNEPKAGDAATGGLFDHAREKGELEK
jgi:hypothetical protein